MLLGKLCAGGGKGLKRHDAAGGARTARQAYAPHRVVMVGGDCTVIGTPVSPPHRTLTASPRDSLDTHASRGGRAAPPRGARAACALAAREAGPREARGREAGPRT
jgi:hypothetical protein